MVDVETVRVLIVVLVPAILGGSLRSVIGFLKSGALSWSDWSWKKATPAMLIGGALGLLVEYQAFLDPEVVGLAMTVLAAAGAAMVGQDAPKALKEATKAKGLLRRKGGKRRKGRKDKKAISSDSEE